MGSGTSCPSNLALSFEIAVGNALWRGLGEELEAPIVLWTNSLGSAPGLLRRKKPRGRIAFTLTSFLSRQGREENGGIVSLSPFSPCGRRLG